MSGPRRYIVAITGASGAIYGVRLVQALLADPAREVHLIVSPAGARVMNEEMRNAECGMRNEPSAECGVRSAEILQYFSLNTEQLARLVVHPCEDIGAGPASGTFRAAAMIVCPCSMKTLAHAATGLADNLIARAADVALKEGRPLILVARETPLSLIHLRNMTRLAEAGAVILPAAPAFYHQPRTIEDLVRHVVQKIFDRLGLELPGAVRWQDRA